MVLAVEVVVEEAAAVVSSEVVVHEEDSPPRVPDFARETPRSFSKRLRALL
jgi:hypothetical protein